MKALLSVLLAASLSANLVMVLRHRPANSVPTTAPSGPDAVSSPASSPAQPAVTQGAAPRPAAGASDLPRWHAVGTEADLTRFVANLRGAGYPPAVIRAMVNAVVEERFAGRQPGADQPFWKRRNPGEEVIAAQLALRAERQALVEQLLGPDARPSATLNANERNWRYGSLSDAKIDAIAKIERDYGEITAETWAKRRGNAATSMETTLQSQALMEREKLADISALLSPEELADYEMRNSNAASTLMSNLRNVDVNAAEYAQLYAIQKAFAAANPPSATFTAAAAMQRLNAQLETNEKFRDVLGDARFYAYVEGADPQYANLARSLATYPSVTPAATYAVYQLQAELRSGFPTSGRTPTAEETNALRARVNAINARLDAVLGAQVAEAYRQSAGGRAFNSFRGRP